MSVVSKSSYWALVLLATAPSWSYAEALIASQSSSLASELATFEGTPPPVIVPAPPTPPVPPVSNDHESRYQISQVLAAEARMSTVADAMAVKRTGLVYVRDMSDFDYLASFTVANPSDAYRTAVSGFIAQNVGSFIQGPYDLSYLNSLERKTTIVPDAMAVKRAGLRAIYTVIDFLYLIPFSVPNPSEAYRTAVSDFVAASIPRVLSEYSPIRAIVEAETYTRTVDRAMAVKQAGLIAVHSKGDLLELARFSVPNPSPAYQEAVNRFIRDHIANYP